MGKAKKGAGRGWRIFRVVAVSMLVTAVIAGVLTACFFPVIRVRGSSMSPTLFEGDVIVTGKFIKPGRGDLCAFKNGYSIQCKRVIGTGGDVIDISGDGRVLRNGKPVDEPYLRQDVTLEGSLELPVTVPEGSYFCMGDNRRVSIDSRSTAVGTVDDEDMIGKVIFRVLPVPDVPG